MNATFSPLWLIGISLSVALVPTFLALATSYLKVSVVMGLLKNALGTQSVPNGIVTMAISFAVTAFIMMPVGEQILTRIDSDPTILTLDRTGRSTEGKEQGEKASPTRSLIVKLDSALAPLKEFLSLHAAQRDIAFFREMQREQYASVQMVKPEFGPQPKEPPPSWSLLMPAFMISELREAFAMAVMLLLPFVAIDLVVANILVGMGMSMVSPVSVALPIKLALFLSSQGWELLCRALLESYKI